MVKALGPTDRHRLLAVALITTTVREQHPRSQHNGAITIQFVMLFYIDSTVNSTRLEPKGYT